MDHNKLHEETIDLVKKLQKNIVTQTNLMNIKLNEMDPKHREQFNNHQADINRILKIAKNGNIGDLQKIVDQYANSDTNK